MPVKKTAKNRVALYMRVSTIEQKPDLQIDELRAYAERAELEIVEEYLDVAVVGEEARSPSARCAHGRSARSRLRSSLGVEVRSVRPIDKAPIISIGRVRSPGHWICELPRPDRY